MCHFRLVPDSPIAHLNKRTILAFRLQSGINLCDCSCEWRARLNSSATLNAVTASRLYFRNASLTVKQVNASTKCFFDTLRRLEDSILFGSTSRRFLKTRNWQYKKRLLFLVLYFCRQNENRINGEIEINDINLILSNRNCLAVIWRSPVSYRQPLSRIYFPT